MKGRLVAYGDDDNSESSSGDEAASSSVSQQRQRLGYASSSTKPNPGNVLGHDNSNTSPNRTTGSTSANSSTNSTSSPNASSRIHEHRSPSRSTGGTRMGLSSTGKLFGVPPGSAPGPSKPRPTAHGIAIRRPPTNRRAQLRVTHISHPGLASGSSSVAESSTSTRGATAHERRSQSANPSNDEDADRDDDDMDISPPPSSSHSHIRSEGPQLNEDDEDTELARLRRALRPRPVPGLQDWGIPPAPTGPVDSEVAKTVSHFLTLKRSPTHPQHFNDALMSTRAFRNPHLYKSLVEWAGVEEKVSCFGVHVKEGEGEEELEEGWYADAICEAQKRRADKEKEGQKKRGHIDFKSSSASGHAPLYQPSAPLYQPSGPTKRPPLNVGANGKMTRWG